MKEERWKGGSKKKGPTPQLAVGWVGEGQAKAVLEGST